jgi:hypothetical protein
VIWSKGKGARVQRALVFSSPARDITRTQCLGWVGAVILVPVTLGCANQLLRIALLPRKRAISAGGAGPTMYPAPLRSARLQQKAGSSTEVLSLNTE